jgi:prepilin-type N-terminal cleavage/methylation domain-containing protein
VKSDAGFSLLETLVAVTLLTIGVCGIAQLSVIATQANQRAQAITMASLLGQEKIEQLRALAWGIDELGTPITDTDSNTGILPAAPTGGPGLRFSPGDALTTNASGYCDFLDHAGRLLNGAAGVPENAAYIRRWSIEPLATDPANTLVIQVRVVARMSEHSTESVRLLTIRARRLT